VVDDADALARRHTPRAGVVLRLQYRNAGHLLVSYCTNLSRGGLFVPSDDPLPRDSELTLRLAVPGREAPVDIQAKVRWSRADDKDRGPAGMGLEFASIDELLGDDIDALVSAFTPMRIELCGDRLQAWSHVQGLLRSLLSCETRERVIDVRRAAALAGADLVIVDLEHAKDPDGGIGLLSALAELDDPPPAIALCSGKDETTQARAIELARVVTSPIDATALRKAVLETVARVRAAAESEG
jgi:uncharacterized protein (TIGR02266 family)